MKNKLLLLKFGLVSVWLAASLACSSAQNQNGGNLSNTGKVNGNSNASIKNENSDATNNAPTETKVNYRDPKFICGFFSDFVNGEYKQGTVNYKCSGKKTLKLSSGRTQDISFDADGDAENVKNVSFSFVTETKFKDNAEADEAMLKSVEELWFVVFKAVLPEDLRKTVLSDKGKPTEKNKMFQQPVSGGFLRHRTDSERYGLNFYFELPK